MNSNQIMILALSCWLFAAGFVGMLQHWVGIPMPKPIAAIFLLSAIFGFGILIGAHQ